MDLKALSQIDLKDIKNIDLSQIKDNIQSRPDIAAIVILIILTLGSLVFTYSKYTHQTKEIKKNILTLNKKLSVVNTQKEIQKEYNNFLESFPKSIPIDLLINKISENAIEHNVQIVSFSPVQEKAFKYSNLETITINISADNYLNMIFFIKSIEDSPYAVRIAKWSGIMTDSSAQRRRGREAVDGESKIISNIEISLVRLKE